VDTSLTYFTKFPFLPILVWNRYCNQAESSRVNSRLLPVGSPYLYLEESIANFVEAKGTIFFPLHGTSGFPIQQNIKRWASLLRDKFPSPFAVSIPTFDPDYLIKKNEYEEQGFECVSFGTRRSHDYLYKLRSTIRKYECLTSDDMGATAVMYGLYEGLTVYHYSRRPLREHMYCPSNEAYVPSIVKEILASNELRGESARAAGLTLLGQEDKRCAEEMTEILGLNSWTSASLAWFGRFLVHVKYRRALQVEVDDQEILRVSSRVAKPLGGGFDRLQP
jgi:hypothetical protein